MIAWFIDEQRGKGRAVESICRVLREQGVQVAARTYRAWTRAQPFARDLADAVIIDALLATVGTAEGMYVRRKMTAFLRRQGHDISEHRVDRLMRHLELNGRVRGQEVRTTIPDRNAARAPDLLDRDFTAPGAEPAVGRGLHLRAHLGRVRLRRVRDRLLLLRHRRLAREHHQDHTAGDHGAADGPLAPRPRRPPSGRRARASQRRRQPGRIQVVVATPLDIGGV